MASLRREHECEDHFLKEPGLLGIEVFDQADGDLGGLLHNVPKLPGHLYLAAALGKHGLNVENGSAHRCPGQACNNAWIGRIPDPVMNHGVHVQKIRQILSRHLNQLIRLLQMPDRRRPAYGIHMLLETADAPPLWYSPQSEHGWHRH